MYGPGVSSTTCGDSPLDRRAGEQRLAQRLKERRQGVDAHRAERVGKHARHDRAVLERVADAGRRLRPRADDAPAAVGTARQIERDEVQKDAVGRRDAVALAQKSGMPEDQRRRQQPLAQQRLRAVEVGGHRVQQPRPLPETSRPADPIPPSE